jgi:hypothetical protein
MPAQAAAAGGPTLPAPVPLVNCIAGAPNGRHAATGGGW